MENKKVLTQKEVKELVEDLLPAVESKFHTYAETMTPAGFKATREHRAFGGFSMGSVTTWYAFIENLPYFSKFVPLSGDSWAIEQMGGETKTEDILIKPGKNVWIIIHSDGQNYSVLYTYPTNAELKSMGY